MRTSTVVLTPVLKLLLVATVEDRLRRLDANYPEHNEARSLELIRLLRIVACLFEDEPNDTTFDRIITDHNIIASRLTGPNATPDVGARAFQDAAVVSDDEDEDEEAPDRGGRGGLEPAVGAEPQPVRGGPGIPFVPNRIYRSTLVVIRGWVIAAGYGFSTNEQGGRYYISESGRRHNLNLPPPHVCITCESGRHWNFQCPEARGNATIM